MQSNFKKQLRKNKMRISFCVQPAICHVYRNVTFVQLALVR